ncbi:MAG: hypothetical protein JST82_04320 [Bacteroidetes bacterium]|nr:hypothetical protein [Bacteroidota bacterium]
MKHSAISTLLIIVIISITSCTSKTQKRTDNIKSYSVDTSLLVSAVIAQKDIAFFDTLCMKYITYPSGYDSQANNIPIKGFTIRAEDILAAIGISDSVPHQFDDIRVYLGYNQSQNKFKLYILPVDKANIADSISGTDVLLNRNGDPVPGPHDKPLTDKYVLDLNAPCPSLCDVNSPLLNANNNK